MEDLSVFIVEKLVTFKLVVHNAVHVNEDQYPGTHCHRQGTLNETVISRTSSPVRELWVLATQIDWLF